MSKKISIGTKPTGAAAPQSVDAWVVHRDIDSEPGAMKRLTIDIPEGLHRAIKSQCAARGTKMANEVRDLLLQKYGNQ